MCLPLENLAMGGEETFIWQAILMHRHAHGMKRKCPRPCWNCLETTAGGVCVCPEVVVGAGSSLLH